MGTLGALLQSPPAYFNFARDIFDHWALKTPQSPALWWIDEHHHEIKYSFADLAKLSRQAAHLFHALGINPGDRVLLMLPRIPEWWIGLLGLVRLGAVPIPATPLLTDRDIAYRLQAAQINAILTDHQGNEKLNGFTGVRVLTSDPDHVITYSRNHRVSEFTRALQSSDPTFDPPLTRATDPGIMYFTSGTAGPPKIVLHNQLSYGLGHRITGQHWLDLKPTDLHWNLSDTGWAKAAWSSFYAPWQMGACIFGMDSRGKFDCRTALDILARYPITTWCAPPTALRMIIHEDLSKWSFPHLRHCVSAGEPLNPEVISHWQRSTGLTIHDGYGQTESTVLIANCPSNKKKILPGSMGHPVPGFDIQILSPDLTPLPAGETGDIAIRIKPHRPLGLFQEYWNNPHENALRFKGDYYLTGDTGYRDADGYFWFVGRSDDVIKSAGYRIGPFEVESALLEHPKVLETAVVASPDPDRGHIVKAYVVLRTHSDACEALKHELQAHCKCVTAPYKYPRSIEFLQELPKTISGKIRRLELRQRVD
jgi:acyl-coenzyme A synthetase/AMP-(fatty) acid ligase